MEARPESKVQIRLSTRHPELQISEEPTLLLVQTAVKRANLSALVNNLLHRDEKPIPFEILVNGQFLRTTIDEYLTRNGLSSEATLNVEYTRALVPPLNVTSFEHDDWVSAVDVLSSSSPACQWTSGSNVPSGQERILSASYDGLLRVWNTSSDVLATSELPNNGGRITSLKRAKWISPSKFVAAGLDNTVRTYRFDETALQITPTAEFYAHRGPVNDLAVHGPSNRILSASGDSTISLFSTVPQDNPKAPPTLLPTSFSAISKRQKLSKPSKSLPARGALSVLAGHTWPVHGVIFKPDDPTVAHSASQDHSLRTWDLTTSTCVDTRTTASMLLSIAAVPQYNLLAAGTIARHITLIDPRASATHISAMTLRGHKNAVSSLAVDPNNPHNLLSGSYDGTARIWDLRNVRPSGAAGEGQLGENAYVIGRKSLGKMAGGRPDGDGVKVFDVAWDKEVGIVSASEDKTVQINQAEGE